MYVLITGASSGLGKELAYIFAKEKYDLILVARREKLLNKIENDLKKYDVDVKWFALDLSKIKNAFVLFDNIKDYKIKYFINNAGFGNIGYSSQTDLNIDMQMIDLNVKSLHILTKLFISSYDNGYVVNISSLAAFLPTPIHATYSATKSYVNYFSRAVNYELKKQRKNVRVLTVAPGPIKTDFNQKAKATSNRGMEPKKCSLKIYKAIIKGKEFIVPGLGMKLVYVFNRFIPTKLLMRISHKIQSNK